MQGISGGLEVEAGSFVLGVALGCARCPFSGIGDATGFPISSSAGFKFIHKAVPKNRLNQTAQMQS
jgi:hypothetical protein